MHIPSIAGQHSSVLVVQFIPIKYRGQERDICTLFIYMHALSYQGDGATSDCPVLCITSHVSGMWYGLHSPNAIEYLKYTDKQNMSNMESCLSVTNRRCYYRRESFMDSWVSNTVSFFWWELSSTPFWRINKRRLR